MVEDRIIQINIEEEMKTAYIDYSMSVIVSRALPDVRDGLKPVQRRVMFSMSDLGLGAGKPYKKSARIVGECFVAGTLVSTPQGLRPIEDLAINDEVFTQNGVQKVSQLYVMPEQPLLDVQTANGASNICTKGQLFKVLTPDLKMVWRAAAELQKGDYLVNRSVNQSSTDYIVMDDLKIDEDLGYFLGFFLADGWVDRDKKRGYHRISFACESLPIIEKIQSVILEKFDVHANISEKGNVFQLRINDSQLNKQLIHLFDILDKYASNITVPTFILESPNTVQEAFVSGFIDGDGSVHKTRNTINIFSISERFIKQLQAIFQTWGIYSSIYESEPREDIWKGKLIKGNHTGFALEITSKSFKKLASLLTLVHPKKRERLHKDDGRYLVEQYDKIPYAGKVIFQEFKDKHLGGGWYLSKTNKKVRAGIKYPDGTKIRYAKNLVDNIEVYFSTLEKLGILKKLDLIDSPYFSIIEDWINKGISFTQVKSVTPTYADITYDIQVENDHEFIANGMLVHNCLGKYHPHGDSSVYEAMVRMAQTWSLRYPLVDGQGNFGSMDGDSPAAMRYTEARLQRMAEDILRDIEKETVDFKLNFDDSLKEPTVLPSRVPNLLINGASGIAVGMATNMLPHNLSEVINGTIAYIDNNDITIDELCQHITAPDFPTGGTIYGYDGVKQGFETGRGRVVVRAKTEIETHGRDRERIIVHELPYQVNKAVLIEKTWALVGEKRIEGISEIRDESDRKGMRIVYELKRDANPQVVLNQLYQFTQLQSSYGVNNVCLVKGRPRLLNIKEIIHYFVEFRHEVVIRRTQYDLKKAEARAHILEGLLIALDNLDAVIKLIRSSSNAEAARIGLMENFELTEIQARAILDMRLHRLTALENDKIKAEYDGIMERIAYFNEVLSNEGLRMSIIKDELIEIKEKYGDDRRTNIVLAEGDISIEDIIDNEQVAVTISHLGYIKRTNVEEFREQNRGGKGSKGGSTRNEDFIEHLFIGSTHDYLLVFTELGKCYWLRVYKIPEGSKTSKGRAIQNLFNLPKEDNVKAYLTIPDLTDREFLENHFVIFCTKKGIVKKTALEAFSRPRQNGIIAISIKEGDTLLEVKLTNGESDILLGARSGRAIRFAENKVREMGRTAAGVRGIKLAGDHDEVIGMACIFAEDLEDKVILSVSEKGYGKRSLVSEYRETNRGGKGIKTLSVTSKTGQLISIKAVREDDGLMIINKSGIVIRMSVDSISLQGRATQGVKLINLNEGDEIASVAKIEDREEDEDENAVDAENTEAVDTTETENTDDTHTEKQDEKVNTQEPVRDENEDGENGDD